MSRYIGTSETMIKEIYTLLPEGTKNDFQNLDNDWKQMILKTVSVHSDNFIKKRTKYLANTYGVYKETRGEKAEKQNLYHDKDLHFLFSSILNSVLTNKQFLAIWSSSHPRYVLSSAKLVYGKKDYKKNNIDLEKNLKTLYKSLVKVMHSLVKDKRNKLQKKYKYVNKYTKKLNKKFRKKRNKKIEICKNNTDFITLDNIEDIPREKRTYVKLNNGIFCFDTESFTDMVKHAKNQRVRGDCYEGDYEIECRDWFYPISIGFNVFINKKNYDNIIRMINNNIQGQEFILTNKRRVDFTTGMHIVSEKSGFDHVYDLLPSTNYLIDLIGGKKMNGKNLKSKKIRKHRGINQKTGRLNKEFRYSGKILKSGLKQIIKKK